MLKKIFKNPTYIFIAYIVISVIIYYPTIGAGMVLDFNGWTMKYMNGSYKDVLNSFGYPGLHQMEQLAFFTLFNLFKFNTFAWYFVFAVLHAMTAFITFKFVLKWLASLNINQSEQISFTVSILFLLSPLAADTVVNKVTIHYFMSNIFIFSALYFLILYFENSKLKNIILTYSLFILALFSLEISYIFPFLFAFIWLSLFYYNDNLRWSKRIVVPVVIPFLLLILFLFLHKIVLGSFIGHYGSEVHTKFDLGEIYSTVIRYFASYTVLFDYWNYNYKAFVSEKLFKFSFFLLPLTFLMVTALGFYTLIKKNKTILIIVLSFILAVIALAPIANLYYAFMFPIENDRYSYLSSVFIYLFIVLLIFQINLKKIRLVILLLFLLVNCFFLSQNVSTFSKSSKLTWSLLNDFRWFDKDVIILADPDNFDGAKMFSSNAESCSFAESLFLHTGIDRRKNIKSAYQMVFVNLNDSVNVEKKSESHYKVQMAQWGPWFVRGMLGAMPFENDWCITEVNKSGLNYYDLYLKENTEDVVFIYAAGCKWSEVK